MPTQAQWLNLAAAAAALAITSPASAAPYVEGCVVPAAGSPLPAFANPDLRPGAPRTPNATNGGPSQATLGFPIHGDMKDERTVALGQAPSIYGTTMTPDRQPIAAARMWLAVADCTGQWRLDSTPLISTETGAVAARLAPFQQPRTLALVYFPTATSTNTSPAPRSGSPYAQAQPCTPTTGTCPPAAAYVSPPAPTTR